MTTFRIAGTAKSQQGDQIVGPFDWDAMIDADDLTQALDMAFAHGQQNIPGAVDVQVTSISELASYQAKPTQLTEVTP
jgi:hypothetical protein